MNLQPLFEKAAIHMLTQNRRSGVYVCGDFQCRYRDKKGRKCGVGALIIEKYYSEDLEDQAADSEDVLTAVRLSQGIDGLDDEEEEQLVTLLEGIQEVHDISAPAYWQIEMIDLGKAYGLNTTPIENYEVQP